MNAIIALCHFCEAHGPAPIFCTQTIRDTNVNSLNFDEQQIPNKLCAACNSIGKSTGIISQDDESKANFVSTQTPVLPECSNLVKQASVRSLSCEISSNKDGGFVFFGDAQRGHVLSHTFHIKDLQARGFYQLFSIIIIMKDKFFLLNIQPFLAEHLTKISEELKTASNKIYNQEQTKMSERNRRMSSNGPIIPATPRSLIDLTGEENTFARLHSHFAWLLLAGAKCLTERITFDYLPYISTTNHYNFTTSSSRQEFNIKEIQELTENFSSSNLSLLDENINLFSIRTLKDLLLDVNFVELCFCAITGIKIIVRGPLSKTNVLIGCLKKILPEQMHQLFNMDSTQYLTCADLKIISVLPEVAVPMPCHSIYRIDFIENNTQISVKWTGKLPNKLPNLLTKIIKAIDEPLINNFVLDKQIQVLIEEWKNKILCMKKIKSHNDQVKLKKILGIQQQDQVILDYWEKYL